jgi:hypothetical protein
MRLITAHRILIGSATLFFIFYAVREFQGTGEVAGSVWRGVVALAGSMGLLVYLWRLRDRHGSLGRDREGGSR